MRSINKRPISFVVRPHPTKQKPVVRLCFTLQQVLEAMKQPKAQEVKNISSGEDVYANL